MATAIAADNDSDYGYDLSLEEESQLIELIDQVSPPRDPPSLARDPIETLRSSFRADIDAASAVDEDVKTELYFDRDARFDLAEIDPGFSHRSQPKHGSRPVSGLPVGSSAAPAIVAGDGGVSEADSFLSFIGQTTSRSIPLAGPDNAISSPDLSNALSTFSRGDEVTAPEAPAEDTRSPLVCFRSYPKKPFSVSDLTAGAWCELQYWYTLTLLPGGKKTRTPAMQGGSEVHKALEDEVHTTVQVDITTKEDAFGLRMWNIIQGLRTLRETGLTRELEVWGIVEGHVVNGIIDGLNYENPDPDFEEEYLSSQGSQGSQAKEQQKITTYLASNTPEEALLGPKVYITDVKTRASNRLPTGVALRPTKIQLFLYHRLLSDMAFRRLDYLQIFRRYGLDPDMQFSDMFMAQVGSLHNEIFHADPKPSPSSPSNIHFSPSSSAFPDLIRYRSLRALVPLLEDELATTFPAGGNSLGTLVAVEYRTRAGRRVFRTSSSGSTAATENNEALQQLPQQEGGAAEDDKEEQGGRLIGSTVFPVDHALLAQYLSENMEWWKGERGAAGVPIEEAYKCHSCEFAEGCAWRREQDEELLRRAREKLAKRAESVGGVPS